MLIRVSCNLCSYIYIDIGQISRGIKWIYNYVNDAFRKYSLYVKAVVLLFIDIRVFFVTFFNCK